MAVSRVPFLGLNHFDEKDESLFFGRDEQLRDVLDKLAQARFVTIIGSSGTGKSSLVHAAVIPALRSGFLTDMGATWHIAKMSPASAPIARLAGALEHALGLSDVEVTLRRGRLGLVEAARPAVAHGKANLLIFIDQFEEIFRYQREASNPQRAADEAAAFVQLLLEATTVDDPPVFVIVTMRSDYLGACAQFRNLPERINTGLYLIPRMRRDQLDDAITGPAAVSGGTFSEALIQKLLNDAGEDPDQLSVLQHALMRTWLNWKRDSASPPRIEFTHYDDTGGVQDGLNNHAEEIYNGLDDDRDRRIAEVLFKCLTERDPARLDIRRPTTVGTIAAIAQTTVEDVERVAGPFRQADVAFLKPPPNVEKHLTAETSLDITHESLIRKWHRLGGSAARLQAITGRATTWVQDEAETRDQYRDLVKRAQAAEPTQDFMGQRNLNAALEWRARNLPFAWAQRYVPDEQTYKTVNDYIDRSVAEQAAQARQRTRSQKIRRFAMAAVTGVLTLLLVAAAIAIQYRQEAARDAELRDEAKAGQLAAQADALRERDSRLEISALLAVEALRRSDIPEAHAAAHRTAGILIKARWEAAGRRPDVSDDDVGAAVLRFSDDRTYLAQLFAGIVHVHRVSDGQEIELGALAGTPTEIAWAGKELRVLTRAVKPGASIKDANTADDDLGAARSEVLTVSGITPPAGGSVREIAHIDCRSCKTLLTPDGTRLVVDPPGGGDDEVYWLEPGRKADRQSTNIIAMAGPGARLQLTSSEGEVAVFFDNKRLGTINVRSEFGQSRLIPLVDVSPSLKYLAAAGKDGILRIYALEKGLPVAGQIERPTETTAFALSNDGALIAIGNNLGEVRVVRWATQRPITGWSHAGRVAALAFSQDDTSIASMDAAGTLRVAPVEPPLIHLRMDTPPVRVPPLYGMAQAFDGSGRFVLTRSTNLESYGELRDIRDATTGRSLVRVRGPLAISPDGQFVYTSDESSVLVDVRPTRSVGDANVTVLPPKLIGDSNLIALSPNARLAASVTAEGQLQVVDLQHRTKVDVPSELTNLVGTPEFSPDGQWLTVYGRRGTYDDPVSVTAFLIRTTTPWSVVRAWTFSARGALFTFAPDSTALFVRFALPRGAPDSTARPRGAPDSTAPFVPFALARGDGQSAGRPYRFMDLTAVKEQVLPLSADTNVSLVGYGSSIIAVATRQRDENALQIFDVRSGMLMNRIPLDEAPVSIAVSPRSRYVAAAFRTAGVRVFDASDARDTRGRTVHELSRVGIADNETISALRFSDDERSIAFVVTWAKPGEDRAAYELDIRRRYLHVDDIIREVCAQIPRSLTEKEWELYLPGYPFRNSCDLSPRGK